MQQMPVRILRRISEDTASKLFKRPLKGLLEGRLNSLSKLFKRPLKAFEGLLFRASKRNIYYTTEHEATLAAFCMLQASQAAGPKGP